MHVLAITLDHPGIRRIESLARSLVHELERAPALARRLLSLLTLVTARWRTATEEAVAATRTVVDPSISVVAPVAAPLAAPSDPVTGEDPWARTVAAAIGAAQHAATAEQLQASAIDQIDAATYALDRLLEDLAGVMTLARQPAASVHRLEPPAATADQPASRALAA